MAQTKTQAHHIQTEFPFVIPEGVDAEPLVFPDGQAVRLIISKSERARRYRIQVSARGEVRIIVPRRGSRRKAIGFAREQSQWIARQIRRMARHGATAPQTISPGDLVLFRGEKVPAILRMDKGTPQLCLGNSFMYLTEVASDLTQAVRTLMQETAERELPQRVCALATEHGCAVSKVVVRDLKASWGRCQHSGRPNRGAHISLNWRLIQAPPMVSDYVILHELMHIREMNHSPRFWTQVSNVCPHHDVAERWLKQFRYRVMG